MRGAFIVNNQLVPNSLTSYGRQLFLNRAVGKTTGPLQLAMGLCAATWQSALNTAQIGEPQAGIGGYQRQVLAWNLGWQLATSDGLRDFIESFPVLFSASGAYSGPVTRCFLCDIASGPTANVVALSNAFDSRLITAATLEAQRTFAYRLYGV
jgi:hypothetical protein